MTHIPILSDIGQAARQPAPDWFIGCAMIFTFAVMGLTFLFITIEVLDDIRDPDGSFQSVKRWLKR